MLGAFDVHVSASLELEWMAKVRIAGLGECSAAESDGMLLGFR